MLLLFLIPHSFVSAQIIPDRSLGRESSRIRRNVHGRGIRSDRITSGARRGSALFHSFREFNVGNGRRVYFTHPAGVRNIFTRVTGNNFSRINGTLGVLGNANLFLINPNGIIFGKGARLELNGSFVGTTASNLVFNNGFEFSPRNPRNVPSNFKINFPIGFNFGTQSGDIIVQGNGNNLERTGPVPVTGRDPSIGLQTQPGTNLTLIANNILLDGGVLTVENGKIELQAIQEGTLKLNSNFRTNNNTTNNQLGQIELVNRSLIDGSSVIENQNTSGEIILQGKKINILDDSIIFSTNSARESATKVETGEIEITASESLNIIGSNLIGRKIRSSIIAESLESGKGSNISIISPQITIKDAAISSTTYGSGDSGNIIIDTQTIQLIDSGRISSSTFNTGQGGNITLNSKNIKLSGISPLVSGLSSSVAAQSLGFANSGNINLTTDNLEITEGGRIEVGVFSESFARLFDKNLPIIGKGGEINIGANNSIKIEGVGRSAIQNFVERNEVLEEVGTTEIEFPSTISSGSASSADAGTLSIYTPRLSVENGAKIISANNGTGNAGTINLNVNLLNINNNVEISTRSAPELGGVSGSGLGGQINIQGYKRDRAHTISLNNGSAIATNNATTRKRTRGTINIHTRDLFLNNGSSITASVKVPEQKETPFFNIPGIVGGNINIDATDKVYLDRQSSITATVQNQPNGNISGGNIRISAGSFRATNNSSVSASVNERGNGGSINISAPKGIVTILDNSDIRANAIDGDGGNIDITTQAFFRSFDSDVDASSRAGRDGIVNIEVLSPSTKALFVTQPEKIELDFEELGTQFCLSPQRHGLRKVKIRNDIAKWATPQYHTNNWDVYFTEAPDQIESWYDVIEPNAMVYTQDGRSYSTALCVRPRSISRARQSLD